MTKVRTIAMARRMFHQIETSLPSTQEALIREMAEAIVQEVDPEQVIHFGSRAPSDATEESDVDLIVVEAEPVGNGRGRLAEEARLCRALVRFDVDKDILVFGLDDMTYWKDSLNHVLARALREGKVFYERAKASSNAADIGGGRLEGPPANAT